MNKTPCFIAYPSQPSDLVETIETAVKNINGGQIAQIKTWKDLHVNGKTIIKEIFDAINESSIFICDITNLNPNVLFELGYAIARNKKIYILTNNSIKNNKTRFNKFGLLDTMRYFDYRNSADIVRDFYAIDLSSSLDNTIFNSKFAEVLKTPIQNNLFYIKNPLNSEAGLKLSIKIDEFKNKINIVVDDPFEMAMHHTLDFYIDQVYNAHLIVVQFLADNVQDDELYNEKVAFVSGLGFGLEKPILMLASTPFFSPLDYKDYVVCHSTAKECVEMADKWIKDCLMSYTEEKAEKKSHILDQKQKEDLKHIEIGAYIAEQENETLKDYFLETDAYHQALSVNCAIFIGRKGAGKTANLLILHENLKSNGKNYVCDISPVGYEIEGILRMVRQTIDKAEKGFLIESFWKFLIYTELMKSQYEYLKRRPSYINMNNDEKELWDFVNGHQELILPEFSLKLENAVHKLQNLEELHSAQKQRLRISEGLHSILLKNIRNILSRVLSKKNKVVILMDNLDKAWTRDNDFSILSELLFGLLDVVPRITHDFQHIGINKERVNLSLIVFLRSDIYVEIIKYAQEKDKLPIYHITWNDPQVLLQIIEKRFLSSCTSIEFPEDVWAKFFCKNVHGIEPKTYILNTILPKPRDLLFFVKATLTNAINHRHKRIEEDDIIQANEEYSKHAFDTIIVESKSRYDNSMEDLLLGFLGEKEIINITTINQALLESQGNIDDIEEIIDLLIDLSFLGLEIQPDKYEFLNDEQEKTKLKRMSEKFLGRHPERTRQFKINKPFHTYLGITTEDAL